MNNWLQTKLYVCVRCGASYLHDRAYQHDLFRCPKRDKPRVVRPQQSKKVNHALRGETQ